MRITFLSAKKKKLFFRNEVLDSKFFMFEIISI